MERPVGKRAGHDSRASEIPAFNPRAETAHGTESKKALAFLARLASEFTAVLNLQDLLDHVIRVLWEETGFDSCGVALLAKQGTEDVLCVRAASGLRAFLKGTILPRGRGLAWFVMESGSPLFVPDLTVDPRWTMKDPHTRSSIFAPMVVQRRPIGVLSAHRAAVNGFAEADLDLLTVVARYLAGAVEVARLHEQLKELAATDSLTGLVNRRAFLERLQSEIARSRRGGHSFCIALLDLNHFKTVNDVHGHAAGDQVLIRVSEALSRGLRETDTAARFGGDEFILLMPETAVDGATELMARLRGLAIPVQDRGDDQTTVGFSWGLASWPGDADDAETLLQAADHRLYEMKRDRKSQKAATPARRPRS